MEAEFKTGETAAEALERRRLEALRALGILDTEPEERFDRLMRLVARHFRVPIALISLVDEKRCWLKSRTGLDAREVPREITFCNHAIRHEGAFVVEDAQADPRFTGNPLVVGPPFIRLYAGEPLFARGGEVLGFLCIIDTAPRALEPADLADLADFARLVEQELVGVERHLADRTDIAHLRGEVEALATDLSARTEDLKAGVKQNARLVVERQSERRRADANQAMAALLQQATHEGVFGVDLAGRITFITPAAAALTGHAPDRLVGRDMHPLLHHAHADGTPYPADACPILATARTGQGRTIEGEVFWHASGASFPVAYATTPILDGVRVVGAICVFRPVAVPPVLTPAGAPR